MKAKHFNSFIEFSNPVNDFQLDFKVGESSTSTFQSGEGNFLIKRPDFEISGVDFSGLNAAVEFAEEIIDQVNFKLTILGDINDGTFQVDNSGALNIEKVFIYTGIDSNIFVNTTPAFEKNVEADEDLAINFSLTREELGDNTGTIFYQIVPFDRINSGEISDVVSGRLLTGTVAPATYAEQELFISRTGINGEPTLNDLIFNQSTVKFSSPFDTMSFNTDIVEDFAMIIDLRTSDEVTLTGNPSLPASQRPNFVDRNDETTFAGVAGVTISGEFKRFAVSKDDETTMTVEPIT